MKLEKFNFGYAAAIYGVGIAVMVLSLVMPELPFAPLMLLGGFLFMLFAPGVFYSIKRKKVAEELKSKGFNVNYTFTGRSLMFYMDYQNNQMAFFYKMNPTKTQILPLSEAKNPRVNDFKQGKGFMEGSSFVALEFDVQGKRQRIYTFTSNKRFTMNSPQILDGISKADFMCEQILKSTM